MHTCFVVEQHNAARISFCECRLFVLLPDRLLLSHVMEFIPPLVYCNLM